MPLLNSIYQCCAFVNHVNLVLLNYYILTIEVLPNGGIIVVVDIQIEVITMSTGKNKILRLCLAAMFAALICVATLVIQIPSPVGGFLNFGDCFILVGAWVMGPFYGAAAGAIGSAMADIFSGYAAYAPATFIIKGAIGLLAAVVARAVITHRSSLRGVSCAAGAAAGEIIMVLGYYTYESLVLGYGFVGAAAAIPMNIMQAAAGGVFGCVIFHVIVRTKVLSGSGIYLFK